MTGKIRKYLLPNLPYLFIACLLCNVGEAYRLASGTDFGGKLLGMLKTIVPAFATLMLGMNAFDLLIGLIGTMCIRLAVYVKGKMQKKYRKGVEYGSARWSA